MANAGDISVLCADGRFIAIPVGVFYHDGPMSEPIDPTLLTGAMRAGRVPGTTTVFVQEQTRLKLGAIDRLRRVLDDIPALLRDRYVLGTLPGERVDQEAWLGLTDAFGIPKHASFGPGLTPSPRVVPLNAAGLETQDTPAAVRLLSRSQAAARETLRSVLDGTPPSWQRLEQLVAQAVTIRDDLHVRPKLRGDEQRAPSGAAYALAAGIALYGIPDGVDPDALLRSMRPISAAEVLRAWGGDATPTAPEDLVDALVATPGSGALVTVAPTGSGRPGLGWLVSRPDGLAWIDPEMHDGAAIRVMPPEDAVSLLRALPGPSPMALRVPAPATALPDPPITDPGTAPSTPSGPAVAGVPVRPGPVHDGFAEQFGLLDALVGAAGVAESATVGDVAGEAQLLLDGLFSSADAMRGVLESDLRDSEENALRMWSVVGSDLADLTLRDSSDDAEARAVFAAVVAKTEDMLGQIAWVRGHMGRVDGQEDAPPAPASGVVLPGVDRIVGEELGLKVPEAAEPLVVRMLQAGSVPGQAQRVQRHEIPQKQAELTAYRRAIRDALPAATATASRVLPADQSQAFASAANAFRILVDGRENFASLTAAEQTWFDSAYRNYNAIYGNLADAFSNLGRYAAWASLAADGSLIRQDVPGWTAIVNSLDAREKALYRTRREAAREVQASQAHIRVANQRPEYERSAGRSIAIAAGQVGNKDAFRDLNGADPAGNGRYYDDAEKTLIDYARMGIMADRYREAVCGTMAMDAFVKFNAWLPGDLIQAVGLLGAGDISMNHSGIHVGPRNQPETLVYDNWVQRTAITNAPNYTVDNLHRYPGTIMSRIGDGFDWRIVGHRYIDYERLAQVDQAPLPQGAVNPLNIGDITHGSYRRNSDSSDDQPHQGLPMNLYGYSANAANYYTPDPAAYRPQPGFTPVPASGMSAATPMFQDAHIAPASMPQYGQPASQQYGSTGGAPVFSAPSPGMASSSSDEEERRVSPRRGGASSGGWNPGVWLLHSPAGSSDGGASWVPSSADGVRAVAKSARSRWEPLRSEAMAKLDAAMSRAGVTDVQMASARTVRTALNTFRTGLDVIIGRGENLSAGAARGILESVAAVYAQAANLMPDALGGASDLPPLSEVLGLAIDAPALTSTVGLQDPTVFTLSTQRPMWAVSTTSALPAYTVGVAPDGSYVVARAPEPGVSEPHGFSGYDVYGPDGRPRGTIDASTEIEEDYVATYFLENNSDVPGVLDLTTFYATGVSTQPFFQSMRVHNTKVQRIREVEYGMEELTVPVDPNRAADSDRDSDTSDGELLRDYRQVRAVTHDIARQRLESRGWTLPTGGFETGQALRPAWTSADAEWAPVDRSAGDAPLQIVTETLDGGIVRNVSGRQTGSGSFEVVDPETGAVVRELHPWTAPGGDTRWTVAPLSTADLAEYGRLAGEIGAGTALEYVQSIVTAGVRLRDDTVLPGFGLYRLAWYGGMGLVRAMVDDQGRVVRARRPLSFDLMERPGDPDLINELVEVGWTVDIGHRNDINRTARLLTLDPYSERARRSLTDAFADAVAGSRSGGPQVYRAEVAPPTGVLPEMLTGSTAQLRLDELRKQVTAAQQRVGPVLELFPSSAAAKSWQDAERSLGGITGVPANGEVTEAVRLFLKAAADVVRLDRTTAEVLAPLSPGRVGPARPVPPPRSFGTWRAGDLAALTDQVGRPVLTVDLSGITPHAIEDLEGALREHQWWGEVPIVVATLGTKVAAGAFAALRERYRPVTVEQAVTRDIEMVWRLHGQDGAMEVEIPGLTADLLRAAAAMPTTPHGTALPPVLAGLLTAGPDATRYHQEHERELADQGVRDALDRLIETAPDGQRLAGFRVALGLPAGVTERLTPVASTALDVEPAYTGGQVPASFAYDFLAQTGGRRERLAMDGLLFQLVLTGRMATDQALELLRAASRTAADHAVVQVFEVVHEAMTLPADVVAANPHEHPVLKALLAKIGEVSSTVSPVGTPPPDCVDPNDRTAFVGRLDMLRDTLRADGQSARATLIETINYILSNC